MPSAMAAAFMPETPAPMHDDLGRVHAGDAAEQHAATAVRAHQAVRADLRRQPAGDLAHRREQRQRAVGQLHRLVGDRGGAGGRAARRCSSVEAARCR